MIKNIEKSDGKPAAEALSLRDLRSFVAVVRAGGVTRAARDLGFAQATLSAHLAALESAIGVPLLEAGRRGANLTLAGQTVLRRAESLLQEAAALQQDARSAAGHATIRLAVCEPVASFRLPPILAAFARRHPHVDVELRVAGHATGAALVASGECVFAIEPKPDPTRAGALTYKPLYEEQMLALLPKGHRLASGKSVALADLRGESLLVGSDVCAYRALVVGALRESDVDVALRVRFGDGTTLVHGVAAGLGVAVLPEGFMRGATGSDVVALPLKRPQIAIGIGLVERAGHKAENQSLRDLRRAIQAGLSSGASSWSRNSPSIRSYSKSSA